ncbi:heat-labile enterotoxin alpha chain domain-containing protein [Hirsutella rhossiliensis]|uniref:Heat-labile enterotoxin alpha chain domain-containing protein n=1 Tax=Hirsutella rhossiliensis TaxID=111463 RepID=A0A9P8SP78_9HYPO|nr:heat-labile enterotoxin alpha chain domain-containing protein [Hirsutella rhossiliensis]KAH0967926.1 heat-labile enterotoxin alpha chain domain-containing protein [Hirsutella rhossiliensis]
MAVSATLLWLFWLGCGNARVTTSLGVPEGPEALNTLFSREDGKKFVWRGDVRDNVTIQRAGGFRPRGSYVDEEEAFDLERHKQGAMAWKDEQYDSEDSDAESCSPSEMGWASAYVSTASSSSAVSHLPWIYLVRATPNMIDTVRALNLEDNEEEFAALGGILWPQVVGHMSLEALQRLNRRYPDGIPDDVAVENVVPNPQYDADRFRDSVADSSRAEGYDRGSMEAAIEFMGRPGVGEVVGWTGQFPLLPVDSPCPSPSASGDSSSEETQGESAILSSQRGQNAALTEEDLLAAAEYLREHDEPCEADSHSLNSYLVVEAEDAIATSLERFDRENPDGPFGHNRGIAEADAFIQQAIDRMRRGQNGVCNLLDGCGSMLGKFSRAKRAEGGASKGLEPFCGKLKKTDACDHIQDVEIGFKLSDDYFSGTYDRLGAILEGPAGKASLEIAEAPPSGFEKWFRVGPNMLDIKKGINKIQLTAAGHYSGTRNDEWKLQDMVLRARCVESGYRVEVDKFKALNAVYKHKHTGRESDQLLAQTVATLDIAPTDWHMRPVCSYIEELKFEFTLSDQYFSGTYEAIVLLLGRSGRILVAQEPSPGFSVSKAVDLKKAFGSDEIPVRDIKQLYLVDLPSIGYFTRDAWKLQGLTFTAKCAGSSKTMEMKKFQSVNQWLQHGPGFRPQKVWSGEINPEDWWEVSS